MELFKLSFLYKHRTTFARVHLSETRAIKTWQQNVWNIFLFKNILGKKFPVLIGKTEEFLIFAGAQQVPAQITAQLFKLSDLVLLKSPS